MKVREAFQVCKLHQVPWVAPRGGGIGEVAPPCSQPKSLRREGLPGRSHLSGGCEVIASLEVMPWDGTDVGWILFSSW